jgi:DNA-binding transcriptional LysR family regulator
MRFTADDLVFLLELTRAQTISSAAKKMGIDQSTISRQLQALEAKVGKNLFSRHRSGLEPTQLVKELLETAEKIELLVSRVRNFESTENRVPSGEVHISCTSAIADRMLAPHVPDFLNKYPMVRIRLSTTNKDFDLNRLECDIAILVDKPARGETFNLRLTYSPLKFFGHKIFTSDSGKVQLTSLPLLCMQHEVSLLKKMSPQFDSIQIRLISNRLTSNLIAAERGAGVLLLPEVFGLHLRTLNLIEVDSWPNLPAELYMASPKAVRRLPHVDAAWGWVKSVFKT